MKLKKATSNSQPPDVQSGSSPSKTSAEGAREVDDWFPLVYAELHRLASSYLRGEPAGQTLQTTSLVNEAYVKLMGQYSVGWRDRKGFFAAAATAMRRILVDRARSRHALKRGGSARREALDDAMASFEERAGNLVELDDALSKLAAFDPRKANIVEIRFFVGLSMDETAAVLNLSPRTVAREWNLARAWLLGELERSDQVGGRRPSDAGNPEVDPFEV